MIKVFEDTLELWSFIYVNEYYNNTTLSDMGYSRYIDRILDDICKEIIKKGFVEKYNIIIKVENL